MADLVRDASFGNIYEDFLREEDTRKEDPFTWASSVRLTLVREEEEAGMYLEEREGRKRKWEGKRRMEDMMDEKEQRRLPPKKVIGAAEMGGAGGGGASSSSSHLSPGWQVNDLDIDLAGELSMNDALLSLPSLTVFKQEAPSPTGGAAGATLSPPRRAWLQQRRQQLQDDRQMGDGMAVDGARDSMDDGSGMCQQSPNHNGNVMSGQHVGLELQCQQQMQSGALMPMNGYHSPHSAPDNKGNGLLICSPVGSLDGFLHSPLVAQRLPGDSFKDDLRFQYVLAAATSIAMKTNEETLTYLNQGQSYEIKLKKLGDLSHYKGKILKSVIKICFHERRLQYMEREQMTQWHSERPGERIVEVDIPLSYGIIRVSQPSTPQAINSVEVLWDPTKDVGVYIKVNCISTEFTAKKHGGEKGVPFRIQVETYLAAPEQEARLHAAACQIKVFKLKGADRKHKQDREKVMRRPRADLEKYQPSCEATVLSTLSNESSLPPPTLMGSSPPYSPEMCVSTPKPGPNNLSPTSKPVLPQQGLLVPANQVKQLYCQELSEVKVNSTPCHSPGSILPDLPQQGIGEDLEKNAGLSKEASANETQAWLSQHRFSQHAPTFANFSGADLLRLSRDDLIQICGLADGIRLFNALHAKRIEPRLTVYVCVGGAAVYSALYLHSCRAGELLLKLKTLLPPALAKECETVLVSGPNGARVRLSDELVRHMPDNSTYRVQPVDENSALLMTPTAH